MAKYKVWINFSGCCCYEIEADSEEEACEIAMADSNVDDCDEWDYDVDSVEPGEEEDEDEKDD